MRLLRILIGAICGLIIFQWALICIKKYNSKRSSFHSDSKSVIKNCLTQEIVGKYNININLTPFSEKIIHDKIILSEELTPAKRQQLFIETFNKDLWGKNFDKNYNGLQKSGPGSMLVFAQEMMSTLHILINDLKKTKDIHVVRILDVPCGDLQWMNRFLESRNDVIYTGMDIVPDIIKHHKKKFAHPNRTYILQDAVMLDKLPGRFDIVICRHMLQHLRIKDIIKVLSMFSNGDGEGNRPSYFVTSNHYLESTNKEVNIKPGDTRFINLELPPFNFAPPICITRECNKCVSDFHEHFVTVYEMPFMTVKCQEKVVRNLWTETGHKLFSCTPFENV